MVNAAAEQHGLSSHVAVPALPTSCVRGYEIADALRSSLDVFVVGKLAVPGREEIALGAVKPPVSSLC